MMFNYAIKKRQKPLIFKCHNHLKKRRKKTQENFVLKLPYYYKSAQLESKTSNEIADIIINKYYIT